MNALPPLGTEAQRVTRAISASYWNAPRIIDDHGRERRHGTPDPSHGRLIGGSDMTADELRRVRGIEADEKLCQARAVLAAHAEGESYVYVPTICGTSGLPVTSRTVDAARTLIEARRVVDEMEKGKAA